MKLTYTLLEEIKAAYINTDYIFTDGSKTIIIRLDEPNPDLLDYLEQEQISSWAFITAWNPYSNAQTEEFNRSQQAELLQKLSDYRVSLGEGKGRDGKWPGEESYFVAGIGREEACEIGRDFGQNAILVSNDNLEPELAFLF